MILFKYYDQNEQADILLGSQAFQRLSNLSIVKKYAALSIDSVSESMLNRVEFNEKLLDSLNQLDDFLHRLAEYEQNKGINLDNNIDASDKIR